MSSDITSTDRAIGETLYLRVYQRVAAKSDYMQPDGYRQMLPEAVIMAGVISVMTAIFNGIAGGFLSKVGENIADQAGKLGKRLTSEQPSPEISSVVFAEAVPMLRLHSTNWDEIAALVALDLTRRGMGFHISQELAREITADLQQELLAADD